jgi:thiamine-phosphate diphosphorylase
MPSRQSRITGLYLIIDQELLTISPEQAMLRAMRGGVRLFQYRSKHGTRKDIYETASALKHIAERERACFIINDHADIAAALDADGVHLGQDDLPIAAARKLLGSERIIGISTHSIEQARAAEAEGADYIGFGPIFATATKDSGEVQGTARLSLIKREVSIPIVAIGGIDQYTIRDVFQAGADSAAVISAVLRSDDISAAAGRLIHILDETGRET